MTTQDEHLRVAMNTGAGSRNGIGSACARLLATEHAVVVTSRIDERVAGPLSRVHSIAT